jgi:hypothetical protein
VWLFPRRDCVVVLAGVKAIARRVAAPALTPAAGGEVELRPGTAGPVVLVAGGASAEVVRLVEDVLAEPAARVEDFDADDPAVFPVEGDEPVDPVGCGGLRGGAARGTSFAVEVDVDGVRLGVVADSHLAIVARRSATSCQ